MRAPAPRLISSLLAVAALVLAALGCGGGEDDGVFVDLLRFVPDTEEGRTWVLMVDQKRYGSILEVEAPSGDLTIDDDVEYLLAQTGAARERDLHLMSPSTVGVLGVRHYRDGLPYLREHMDLGFADVDAAIRAHRFVAMRGRFNPTSWNDRLEACDVCVQPQRNVHRGWETYEWEPHDLPPRAFNLDVLQATALSPDYMVVAAEAGHLHAAIDAREGRASLAEYEPFRLLAVELERLRTVDAMLTSTTQGPEWAGWAREDPRVRSERIAAAFALEEMTALRPYVASATGGGVDEDGEPFTAVVIMHERASDAEENAGRIQQRFAEFIERDLFTEMTRGSSDLLRGAHFDAIEVEQRDRVVVARLYGGGGRQFALHYAPLFLHE